MQEVELLNLQSILVYLPEIILCGVIVLLLFCNLFGLNKATFFVAIIGVLIHQCGFSAWNVFNVSMTGATIITMILSGRNQRVEFYALIVAVLLGADLLIRSSNFIMILLSMEIISLSSYVLTAGFDADKKRAEAAWKFFIYGSAATAVMIFGMTYHFGATGEIQFMTAGQNGVMLNIGVMMILAGFLFKMTAAPFHLWAPDVYEATSTPIVAFLSVVPKLAAFSILTGLASFYPHTDITFAAIAIFTIVVGTLAALNQSDSKRMMAYSSVAQAGFLLAIIATGSDHSVGAFYVLVFAIMNYVVFIVIHAQEQSGNGTSFASFNGIGYTNPFPAVAIALGLVSLVGLPPMAGFMAKLFVFKALWTKVTVPGSPIFLALLVVGLLATVGSLFFYLKIPFYSFFRRSEEKHLAHSPGGSIKISLFLNLLLAILVGLLLALFLGPGLVDGMT